MDLESVSAALQELHGLAFPTSPVDSDLGDWIMELLEADSYYAGAASSALGGAPFTKPPRQGLDELTDGLRELRVASPADQAILDHCHTYLAAVQRLHEQLRS